MKKKIQHKRTSGFQCAGELPATDGRGICAAAAALRDKHRSPFGFCGPRRSSGQPKPQ